MSFDINTNVASLQAQSYLSGSTAFQNKTIQRVTSGLRIVNSGDDAAGLAVANGYRSDAAVLTQGIQNASNGLNQLQIADSGLNNISTLLDRARTLATESASGAFQGDRGALNAEFQSVITEINRQAQATGLNTGGDFAKSLSVFIGGGKASGSITANQNGSITLDLTKATVDAKSLGLTGVQSVGGDISGTSVAQIMSANNGAGGMNGSGVTTFFLSGPGFSGQNKVALAVQMTGVTDANSLVTAINAAITKVGNSGSPTATAFKNANIAASVDTSGGAMKLTFASGASAFQVQAGDTAANALMGNFAVSPTNAVGKGLLQTVTGAAVATGATSVTNNITVHFTGAGLAQPVDIALTSGSNVTTTVAALSSLIAGNADLQAAGISMGTYTTPAALTFTSNRGEAFSVDAVGDALNTLGLGTWAAADTSNPAFDYSSITGGTVLTTASKTDNLLISVAGGAAQAVTVVSGAADTQQTLADQMNRVIQANATLKAAGITATLAGGKIQLASSTGTNFRVTDISAAAASQIMGFAGDQAGTFTGTANALTGTTSAADFTDSTGAMQTGALSFNAIVDGGVAQTLNVNAVDASGANHPLAISLDSGNASSMDQAIATINTALQATNDPSLGQITAVKEYDSGSGSYKINFVSTLSNFSVGIGQVGDGSGQGVGYGTSVTGKQGTVVSAALNGDGGAVDISNVTTAATAVTALGAAVAQLGLAQAVVGRGENQFTYAMNLAQSQLRNTQTAEAGIRDADLAAEAANLTKAQILVQAGVAALAQANSAPQQVLSLLRG